MPIAALCDLATPAAQALVTREVGSNEQGRLQGAIASLASIAGIIAPTLFTRSFAAVTGANLHDAWAGITFGIAAIILAIAWLLARQTTARIAIGPAAGTDTMPDAIAGVYSPVANAVNLHMQPATDADAASRQ